MELKSSNKKSSSFLWDTKNLSVISYVPYLIGPAIVFFLWENKKLVEKHMKYSAMMAVIVVVLSLLLRDFFASIVTLAYLIVSGILAYKAYSGSEIKIAVLDSVEEQIKKTQSK